MVANEHPRCLLSGLEVIARWDEMAQINEIVDGRPEKLVKRRGQEDGGRLAAAQLPSRVVPEQSAGPYVCRMIQSALPDLLRKQLFLIVNARLTIDGPRLCGAPK